MLPIIYSVTLNSDFTGVRFGLHFLHGKAQTDDAFLASRLSHKGYNVFAEKTISPVDIDDLALTDLNEKAAPADISSDEVAVPLEETAEEKEPQDSKTFARKCKAKADAAAADGGI